MMIKQLVPLLLCAILGLTFEYSPASALGGSNCFSILKKRRNPIKKYLLDMDGSEVEAVATRKKISPEASNMKATQKRKSHSGGRRRGSKKITKNGSNNDLGWIENVSVKDELGWIAQVSSL